MHPGFETEEIEMKLELFPPLKPLQPYVAKIWVFSNSGRLPSDDMKLIVPNGMVKLIIPVENGLVGRYDGWSHHSQESSITLIGIADSPAYVDVAIDAPHTNIGIEFNPLGAYRIFRLRHADLKNKIVELEDVLGVEARLLNERIADTPYIGRKIEMIQAYLLTLLHRSEPDLVLDYCLRQIAGTKGLVTVTELEKKSGYSSRWLYNKFIEKVGLSPKNLSSVTRFMQFYEASAVNPTLDFFKDDIYDYFYDQAHFIKDFKRFTGMPPSRFIKTDNGFGHIFYRD